MIRHILLAIVFAAGLFSSANRALGQAGGDARRAQANAVQPMPMTYADLERLYLDGKITAKQYQKYLNEMKSRPAPPPVAAQPAPLPPPSPVPLPTPQRLPAPAPQPLPTTPPAPAVSPKNERINEVEAKMDELIKAKAAREKATN